MVKFACKNCNYKFTSEVEQRDKVCPYCGKKAVMKDFDAEDLIKSN
jgi:DNA-directed RNA polymerase subunit RPC12/RpoP